MKTILAIDDDVLVAAMAIAQIGDRDLGQVISDLARRALPAHRLEVGIFAQDGGVGPVALHRAQGGNEGL